MCVPNVFDRQGFEEEVQYCLKEMEISLCNKGKLDASLLTVPLPNFVVNWHQNKQGRGQNKTEQFLSFNNLDGFKQKGCLVSTVEAAVDTWPCFSPLWQHFYKTGMMRQTLGRHCAIVVMYSGNRTNVDRSVMQRYRQCNVIYDIPTVSHTFPHIVNVHKSVEVQMEDVDAEHPYNFNFTDLCWEIMMMTISGTDPAIDKHNANVFDTIIPILGGKWELGPLSPTVWVTPMHMSWLER